MPVDASKSTSLTIWRLDEYREIIFANVGKQRMHSESTRDFYNPMLMNVGIIPLQMLKFMEKVLNNINALSSQI